MARALSATKCRMMTAVVFVFVSFVANADSFSCSFGQRAACLDFEDKVCGSFAKCVRSDATCFDSNTCGYKGFICKASYDDLATKCKKIASDYDDLLDKYNGLVDRYNNTQSNLTNLRDCIGSADSLEAAKVCE